MEIIKYKIIRLRLKYLYYIKKDMIAYDNLYSKTMNNKYHSIHIEKLINKRSGKSWK